MYTIADLEKEDIKYIVYYLTTSYIKIDNFTTYKIESTPVPSKSKAVIRFYKDETYIMGFLFNISDYFEVMKGYKRYDKIKKIKNNLDY